MPHGFGGAETNRHEHRSRNKWGGDRYADPRKGSRAGAKCGARSQQGIRCSADTQVQVEAPFEYAERLASLVRRQQEIEDELDLTKSHAPGGLDGKQNEASPENGAPGNPEPEVPDLG